MSGGHWNYQSFRIEDEASHIYSAISMLSEIEHILDWGYSGDTCSGCAELEAIKLLCNYFDSRIGNKEGYTWGDRSMTCDRCQESDRRTDERRYGTAYRTEPRRVD